MMNKKPMLNAVQKPKMAYMKKPKFNAKLKSAAKSGKLDNNPKFKEVVMKSKPKMAMNKKPKMMGKKKPMMMAKKKK